MEVTRPFGKDGVKEKGGRERNTVNGEREGANTKEQSDSHQGRDGSSH